ncbi:hypothetical protein CEXT_590921, partial [Caerostris extrusa]
VNPGLDSIFDPDRTTFAPECLPFLEEQKPRFTGNA